MFGPPRREAWPARGSTRTAADARKFGEAYPDPWPTEGTTRASKAAARRGAQLAESRKPREVSRSYEPSAEHLHAGNDWVQSCFRATDDYENEPQPEYDDYENEPQPESDNCEHDYEGWTGDHDGVDDYGY